MYAAVDFWVALLKGDDWLTERAEELYAEHGDDLEVSLTTFVELFLIEEQFSFDREQAVISILEMTNTDVDEQVVFQASEYIDDGLNVFDAFHAALAGDVILSSDKAFDDIGIERVQLEPETATAEAKAEAEDE
ncbi:PIN domain-containing protein [Halorussus ruber]|uniref:PIN domain-containing protein n=1 Tax=Halorussus ruber TaxID=1126238 RepID=UPI00109305E6